MLISFEGVMETDESNQMEGQMRPRSGARNTDPFLSTAAAAEYLGVPEGTLRYWRYCQTGPRSFKLGRRRVYRVSDLEAWARTQACP